MASSRSQPQIVDGRFRNPPGAPRPDCGPLDFAGFVWRRMVEGQPRSLPSGHVLPAERVHAGLAEHADRDALTWLGHASFLIRLAGRTLLTDPYLSDVAAPWPVRSPRRFAPPALGVDQLPDIDLLLVSHNHYDHLDAPTVEALRARADVPVVVPLGLGGFFSRRGYGRVSELGWWESCRIDRLTVTAVPAIHFSRRGPFDANKSLWCGFVIEDETGTRVHFVGDTAYSPVFAEIGDAFAPIDCALVPIGAYEPRCIMAGSHVNPEEAAALCGDVGAHTAVAMHWGAVMLTEEPPFEPPARFREAMAARGMDDERVLIPAIGETLPMPLRKTQTDADRPAAGEAFTR